MAHQPYRPSEQLGAPAGGSGFAAPPPLQFVASSFAADVQLGAAGPNGAASSFAAAYPPPAPFAAAGGFGLPQRAYGGAVGSFAAGASSFDDEPPLLEELGIDLPHILRKTRSMLRPFRADPALCDDGDLAGPLLFAFALGSCHLLARGGCAGAMGKVNFGYILGWSVLTMLALHWLVNMLAGPAQGIELYRCGSLLGYCLLPIVLFSAAAVVLPARGTAVCTLGMFATLWSTSTASSLLTALVPALEGQRMLVAYPCGLVYGLFTLLTIG